MKIRREYWNHQRQIYECDTVYEVIRETKTQLIAVIPPNEYEYRFRKPDVIEEGVLVNPVHRERFSMYRYKIDDDSLPF